MRETEPVNMDQKASKRIAAKTQNLYPLLPKKPATELCFFALPVVCCCTGIAIETAVGESWPFILRSQPQLFEAACLLLLEPVMGIESREKELNVIIRESGKESRKVGEVS